MSLLGQKDLSNMPVRIQRFKMRLMRFLYTVTYVQGVSHKATEALSTAPATTPSAADQEFVHEIESFGEMCASMLLASTQ